MRYLYLHGFASGPTSSKGVYLAEQMQALGLSLECLDFNVGGFESLTISRQIEQTLAAMGDQPATVIGSSLGGLTAAWAAERSRQVTRLILLAPAFQFVKIMEQSLGTEALAAWQAAGSRPFFHYAQGSELNLEYGFWCDALSLDERQLQRPVPTLIVHGRGDTVVPLEVSSTYAASRPWVELRPVEGDHSLGNQKRDIWALLQAFCEFTPL